MGARVILLLAFFSIVCQAQQEHMQELLLIRHKVVDSISRMPRYLCTELVDRKTMWPDPHWRTDGSETCGGTREEVEKRKGKFHLISEDRLRLDVAVIDNNETYSWVGAGQFDDRPLVDRVQHGATATGSFVAFLQAIFVSDNASFKYKGEEKRNGQRILGYTFTVPLWRSGWTISNGPVNRLTGYSGEFSADANTLDLLSLDIHADAIAEDLNMCEVSTTLNYSRVRLNSLDFLLPSEAGMRILKPNGLLSDNRTVFSGCHQFTGESTLIFDGEASAPKAIAQLKPNAINLPADLNISIALVEAIDPAKAAAGDAVKGRLTKPITVPGTGLTIPQGATLNGRISELLVRYGSETSLELGLTWESLDFGGTTHTLDLSSKSAVPGTAKVENVRVERAGLGRNSATAEQSTGYFVFPEVRKSYRIPTGFETEWITLSAKPAAK